MENRPPLLPRTRVSDRAVCVGGGGGQVRDWKGQQCSRVYALSGECYSLAKRSRATRTMELYIIIIREVLEIEYDTL